MANHTTKAQRDQWVAYAAKHITLDHDTRCTNWHAVRDQIVKEFGVSESSATTAVAAATRRARYALR